MRPNTVDNVGLTVHVTIFKATEKLKFSILKVTAAFWFSWILNWKLFTSVISHNYPKLLLIEALMHGQLYLLLFIIWKAQLTRMTLYKAHNIGGQVLPPRRLQSKVQQREPTDEGRTVGARTRANTCTKTDRESLTPYLPLRCYLRKNHIRRSSSTLSMCLRGVKSHLSIESW